MDRRRLSFGWLVLSPCFALVSCAGAPAHPAAAPRATTCATAAPSASVAPPQEDADRALYAFFDQEWERTLRENPTRASALGDRRYDDKWPEMTVAAFDRELAEDKDALAKLHAIDRARLSPKAQLDYDLFEHDLTEGIEGYAFHDWLLPVSQQSGPQQWAELAESLSFRTRKSYEDWTARLRAYGDAIDQTILLMRQGMREKIVQPRVIMQRVPGQIDKQIAGDPTKSDFYVPFLKIDPSIADPDALRADAAKAITDVVVPALRRLRAFVSDEYLPACFDEVGAWQLPRGDEYYRFKARSQTTTNKTPEEIHALGQSEVARIRAEMEALIAKIGFKGTRADFFRFLRTDPKFFFASGDALFEAYAATAKRIDPKLVLLFKTLPRMPYGVQPIPMATAPDVTTAFYREGAADGSRAGTYYVNLYKPEARPKWEMMALTLHESVPGHHLQLALSMEQGELPKFRRYGGYTAFVEGWALYAESLGDEVGLYDDPYAKFGQLTYEMWRAVRLVVDTGMHAMKWDRKKAIDFFMDNAAKTELDVTNEIDRYIADPGQALAYKIGQLTIEELRARAAQKLGPAFDVREFHDVVLGQGSLPLDVLSKRVDDWIASKH